MDNHIQRVAGMKDVDIERTAVKLLAACEPERLLIPGATRIMDMFHRIGRIVPGADYGVVDLPFGDMGRMTPDGCVELSESTYIGALSDDPRCRWTVAHELGHLILHLRQIRQAIVETGRLCLARAADVPPYANPEIQAHKFAAGLLCPMTAVDRLLKNVPRSQWESKVAATFLISKEAASKRVDRFCRSKGDK